MPLPNVFQFGRDWIAGTLTSIGGRNAYVMGVQMVDAGGEPVTPGATAALPAGTDRSGSITTGGTAQNVAAANTARRGFTLQNTSDTEMRVSESGTAASATTGYQIAPGGRFTASTNRAISVFGATTGKTFAATEW